MLAFALKASTYFLPPSRQRRSATTQLLEAAATHAYTAEDRDSILALRPSPPAVISSPSRAVARNDTKTRATTGPVQSSPAPSTAEVRRSSKTRSLPASIPTTSRAVKVAAPHSDSLTLPTVTRTTHDSLTLSPRSTRPIKTADVPKRTTTHARKVAHLTARLAAPAYCSLPAAPQAAAREHGLKLIDLEEPRERDLAALRLKATIMARVQVTARDDRLVAKSVPATLESREVRMARFADRLARLLRRVHGCAHRRADEWVANGFGKYVK
ncbi:hypothetical protein JCM10207_007002 [Rhodosporidiobolus poonsookiae]